MSFVNEQNQTRQCACRSNINGISSCLILDSKSDRLFPCRNLWLVEIWVNSVLISEILYRLTTLIHLNHSLVLIKAINLNQIFSGIIACSFSAILQIIGWETLWKIGKGKFIHYLYKLSKWKIQKCWDAS